MLSPLYFVRDEGLTLDIERGLWQLHYSLSIDSLLSLVFYTNTVEYAGFAPTDREGRATLTLRPSDHTLTL